jgi:hypothetical protein
MTTLSIGNTNIKTAWSAQYKSTQNGEYTIKGVVQKKGINIPCRVRLYEKSTGNKLHEVATDDDGNYEFKYIAQVKCFVIAHDPQNQYNAVIQDNVVPK